MKPLNILLLAIYHQAIIMNFHTDLAMQIFLAVDTILVIPGREQPESSKIGKKVKVLRYYCTDLLEFCVAIKMTFQKNI